MGIQIRSKDLFALSDSLQMELKWRDITKKTDTITGQASVKYKFPSIGLVLTFKPKIVSSRIYGDNAGITNIMLLLKVQGELYMLVHQDVDGDMIHIHLLNGLMLADRLEGFFGDNSRAKGSTLVDKLKKAFVASYHRRTYDKVWKAAA